jgi:hypothetical protein
MVLLALIFVLTSCARGGLLNERQWRTPFASRQSVNRLPFSGIAAVDEGFRRPCLVKFKPTESRPANGRLAPRSFLRPSSLHVLLATAQLVYAA